ncbi:hypothetical protein AB4Y89_10045 [Terriglobus sp. 2YAB30_2]|uniref:hypothetical protein n=1 Tax=unclassified Terriglobus TaxID=2628988 RepID=UPI003F980782
MLYLLPIVAAPLLMFAAAFVIIPSKWFALRAGNTYMANLGYGAELNGRDCQVLVYGDSTAMVGADPKVIAEKSGLTACNIAEFGGVTLVSGTEPVDKFLSQNPRPKYIVFLYAPEGLSRPFAWEHVGFFEAITYRVREEHTLGTAWTLAMHPGPTLGWAEQGLRMALTRVKSKPISEEKAHVRERDLGQLKVVNIPDLQSCSMPTRLYEPDPTWIAGLRSKYSGNGTTVVVDATPVMNCDQGIPFYQAHLAGLVDDLPLPEYPVTDYADEHGQRMHMNAKGAAKVSAMIGNQIRAMQGER